MNRWHFPLNLFKQATTLHKLVLWLLVTSLALLMLPLRMAQSLFLQQWIEQHAASIGLVAMTCVGYLLSLGIRLGLSKMLEERQQGTMKQRIREKIGALDHGERAVLREFILQGKSSIRMPIHHHSVADLLDHGILAQAGASEEYAIEGTVAPVKIAALARRHITRKVLRLPEEQLTEQQREHLLASRPEFAANLNRSGRHAA